MKRDSISLRQDFPPIARLSLELWAAQHDLSEMLLSGSPQTWAWLWFLLIADEKREVSFATVRHIQSLLNECASVQLST